MDIQLSLLPLIGEYIVTNAFNKHTLVLWAYELAAAGFKSKHLSKLAQLHKQRNSTVEKYFNTTLQELNITLPQVDQSVFILAYAKQIAQQVINNEVLPHEALALFLDIIDYTKNDPVYIDFSKIIMEIHLLNSKKPSLGSGMTLDKSAEYIIEECNLFLQMEALNIPVVERLKSYCNQCNDFVRYTYESTPDSSIMYICPRCHCPDILLPFQQVKRKLIAKYSKQLQY